MTRGAVAAVVFLVLSGMTGRAQSGCLDEDDAAARSGNYDLAIEYYSNCIDDGGLAPIDLAAAFFSRGKMHHIKGMNRRALVDYERAIADYDRAIDLGVLSDGDLAVVFASLGDAHRDIRRYDQAIANYGEAIDLGVLSDGELAIAFSNRGDAHYKKGRYDPAIADFDRSIRLDPDQTDAFDRKAAALNDKAWTLATSNDALERDGVAAVCLAREAVRLNDGPALRDTLAAAHAEAGQFDDAVAEQERAIEMLRAAGQYDEIADYQTRLDLYRRRQPYRD